MPWRQQPGGRGAGGGEGGRRVSISSSVTVVRTLVALESVWSKDPALLGNLSD